MGFSCKRADMHVQIRKSRQVRSFGAEGLIIDDSATLDFAIRCHNYKNRARYLVEQKLLNFEVKLEATTN
jgi:hypothetical protein